LGALLCPAGTLGAPVLVLVLYEIKMWWLCCGGHSLVLNERMSSSPVCSCKNTFTFYIC
jgi:hypothetical protein